MPRLLGDEITISTDTQQEVREIIRCLSVQLRLASPKKPSPVRRIERSRVVIKA